MFRAIMMVLKGASYVIVSLGFQQVNAPMCLVGMGLWVVTAVILR